MSSSDPSLSPDYIELQQTELPVLITSSKHIIEFQDILMLRIFKNSNSYKIQLTSQNNINFGYRFFVGEKGNTHSRIQSNYSNENSMTLKQIETKNQIQFQNLNSFGSWVRDLLRVNKVQEGYIYKFIIPKKSLGILKIYKKQKFKEYQVANIQFHPVSSDELKENLMYRYRRMENRKQILEKYFSEMMAIIKTKNPTLCMNLEKQQKKQPVFK